MKANEDVKDIIPSGKPPAWLDVVLANLTEAVIVIDDEWNIVFVNDALTRLLNKPYTFFFGTPLRNAWHVFCESTPVVINNAVTLSQEALRTLSGKFEIIATTKIIVVDVTTSYIPSSRQGVFVIRDITAMKNEEESRLRQVHILLRMLESLGEGVFVCDENGRLLLSNPMAEEILGVGVVDMSQERWTEHYGIFYPDTVTPFPVEELPLSQALQGKSSNDVEMFIRNAKRPQGAFISVTARPIYEDGKIKGGVASFADITERKQQENEIRRSNKELEAFTYSVSHDLRAPLRAVDGFARMLIEDYAKTLDKEGMRILSVVRANAQHMAKLIDDLLAFSRFGRQEVNVREVDMTKLAKDVFAEIKPSRPNQKIECKIHKLPPAMADPSLIRQIWMNLFTNAVKYSQTKEKSIIEVGGSNEGDMNTYYVKDNGVGFDMKYVDKLFGVFQRLHSPAEFEGTGVGLAIVERIVTKHGGRVKAEGMPNQGATFSFQLPRLQKNTVNSNGNIQ